MEEIAGLKKESQCRSPAVKTRWSWSCLETIRPYYLIATYKIRAYTFMNTLTETLCGCSCVYVFGFGYWGLTLKKMLTLQQLLIDYGSLFDREWGKLKRCYGKKNEKGNDINIILMYEILKNKFKMFSL